VPESVPLVCLQNCSNVARRRQAEEIIVAANAQIVLQSFLLPSISLTGREG